MCRRAASRADPAAAVCLAPAGAALGDGVLPTMFVPAVLETIQPEPSAAAIPPRRARRRSKADGIELEIAGVEVRVGADAKPRAIEAVIRALKAHS